MIFGHFIAEAEKNTHMGRKGHRAKIKTVLKPVNQGENLGDGDGDGDMDGEGTGSLEMFSVLHQGDPANDYSKPKISGRVYVRNLCISSLFHVLKVYQDNFLIIGSQKSVLSPYAILSIQMSKKYGIIMC